MALKSSKKSVLAENCERKSKLEYQHFCELHSLPVFYNSWYLDASFGTKDWSVLLAKDEEKIIGVWPILLRKKFGISYISPPYLSPYLGPWYLLRNEKNGKVLYDYEFEILNSLCTKLPKANLINAQFIPEYTNWLPLHHHQFTQSTRYTYKIDLSQSNQILWDNIDKRQQQLITEINQNSIIESTDCSAFYLLLKSTFSRQKINVPYSFSWFQHLFHVIHEKNNCNLYFFLSPKKEIVAGVLIVHDSHNSYLLATAKNYSIQDNESIPNLIWHAILRSKVVSKSFDFEGSMLKGVEYFFRSFGGKLSPYMSVQKVSPAFLKIPFSLLGKI